MKPVATVIAACTVTTTLTLSFAAAAAAQQAQPPETAAPEEEAREGIPASPHQEQALREIEDDLLGRLDENDDGSISRQEAQGERFLQQNWNEYDRNGDQMLDPQEVTAYATATTAGADARAEARGRTAEGLPVTRHQQEAIAGELIDRLDEDGDGVISEQEAQAEARLRDEWAQLDQDDDGQLDTIELSQLEQ